MNQSLIDISAIICALACIGLWRSYRSHKRRGKLPLPPGPKGLPVIGNVLDFRGDLEWNIATRWKEQYGPLVYINLAGTSVLFLNKFEEAAGMLRDRGSIYSSRPQTVMNDLEGWSEIFAVSMPYNEELKHSRQMMHRFLAPAVVDSHLDLQLRSTHKILAGLLKTPDKYFDLVRYSAGETILQMTYGYQVADHEKTDPLVELAEEAVLEFTKAQHYIAINAFPWLKYLPYWLPGAAFQKVAKHGRDIAMTIFREPHAMVKKQIAEGTAVPSITTKLIDSYTEDDGVIKYEDRIAKTTCIAYAGGSDTTVAVMLTFFLAMVLHPEVAKRAQEELDRVVGKNNLPSFDDRPNLPYITAIVKESLRWQPVFPLGVAHSLDQDDEYNGYFIPAGTIIFPNIWALSRDTSVYENPEEFIPERWLPKDGKEPPIDSRDMAFGFGRRICPGRHFAFNTVFIGVSSILACFNIGKALDEKGKPITPSGEYVTLSLRHPKPFKYSIEPRSKEIVEVIRQAVESTK